MSAEVTIRSVVKSDELKIKDLLIADVYHWTEWVKPIFLHGILGLLATPILLSIFVVCVVGFCYDLGLASILALPLVGLVLVTLAAKVLHFSTYYRHQPEFANGNLTEVFSRGGCAFFV